MATLNADLKTCPAGAFRNFKRWTRIQLPAQTRLFKFTGHDLFDKGRTTPWWALVEPHPPLNDPGLDAVLAAGRRSGRPLVEFVRDLYAVMFEWNSLSSPELGALRIQYARLLEPVVCFHGQASAVHGRRPPLAYPPKDQRSFAGGAYQVYIPNVTGGELMGERIGLIPDAT